MATTKKKRTRSAKKGTTGQLRVRRAESERRVVADEQFSGVRQEISAAVDEGVKMREDIEARINAVLYEDRNQQS